MWSPQALTNPHLTRCRWPQEENTVWGWDHPGPCHPDLGDRVLQTNPNGQCPARSEAQRTCSSWYVPCACEARPLRAIRAAPIQVRLYRPIREVGVDLSPEPFPWVL